MNVRKITGLKASLIAMVLASCSASISPENLELEAHSGAYQSQYRDLPKVTRGANPYLVSPRLNAEKCLPLRGGGKTGFAGKGYGLETYALRGERLSRGDLLDIRVADDDTFTGSFEISRNGTVRLPFLPAVMAHGRSVDAVQSEIARLLVRDGFYTDRPLVSVRLQDYASASVSVTGAVFEPRPVEIGGVAGDRVDTLRQTAIGASTEARDLAFALRAAGGIRPDADLSAVELRRNGKVYRLDLRGVLKGEDRGDILLLTGDVIHVPSRQCFQDDLMVPSPITPPGVTLFLSNLTVPADSNSESAIGRSVREVPYGTRYMQAVFDLNCIGGIRATSAHRAAALYSRNPITDVSVVISRDLETMLDRADRDDYDPYILPGDALACYDSSVTNIGDVARTVGAIVGIGS